MKHLKVTTQEIAKICKVSQGTVARALNNRPDIKAETKQKILEVAKKYGYRDYVSTYPDKISGQIGIIVFNLNNEYFSRLITEVEYALRPLGLGTLVMMSHYDKEYEIECIRNMYNMGVKGIILCSVNGGENFRNYLELFDMPIVAVGNRIDGIPYVGIDDFSAMKDMTEHVLKSNPKKIIYFSPALNYPDAYAQRQRYEGFLSAVGSKEYSVVTNINDIKESYDEPTTIVCSTDYYSLKAYFKSPKTTITGFDNIDAIDKYRIPITSVGYSMTEIARASVDLIQNLKKQDLIIKHYIYER